MHLCYPQGVSIDLSESAQTSLSAHLLCLHTYSLSLCLSLAFPFYPLKLSPAPIRSPFLSPITSVFSCLFLCLCVSPTLFILFNIFVSLSLSKTDGRPIWTAKLSLQRPEQLIANTPYTHNQTHTFIHVHTHTLRLMSRLG